MKNSQKKDYKKLEFENNSFNKKNSINVKFLKLGSAQFRLGNLTILLLLTFLIISCSNDDNSSQESQNNPPNLIVTGNQEVVIGAVAKLDASGSTDPDGDPLTYNWSFLMIPEGSTATIIGIGNKLAEFTLDKPGVYEVQLVVSDGKVEKKESYMVTNKTPVIMNVSTVTSSPYFSENLMQRRQSIWITAQFFSSITNENKISIGDIIYEIEDLEFFEDNIGVVRLRVPDDAVSGDLKITVGEQSTIWSETMYTISFPVDEFVQDNDHLEKQRLSDQQGYDADRFFEIGTKFKPLVNGKIFGFVFKNNIGSYDSTVTLWDNATGKMLKQFDISTTYNPFTEPIAIEKDKEYTISHNGNNWFRFIDEPSQSNQFPQTYTNVELLGTVAKETSQGEIVFPDEITHDYYIVHGPDIIFAENPIND